MALIKHLDFDAKAAQAKGLTDAEIWAAILDCQKTLPSADAMDRAHAEQNRGRDLRPWEIKDDGGYYRDEISVLRAEMTRRNKLTIEQRNKLNRK